MAEKRRKGEVCDACYRRQAGGEIFLLVYSKWLVRNMKRMY
jgi:hypothetical protein